MFPVAYCADRFGRRITIQLGAAVYMFVCDLAAITNNLSDFGIKLAWGVRYKPGLPTWI